jgi:acetobutylicum phosphotransbutyrylase
MPFKHFHTLIRKFAHFSEYALLGILVSTVSSHTIEERQQKLVIILWMILVPILDEGIQYFTPGRSAELRDCLIDMCGFGFGFLIAYLIKQRKTK